MSPVKLIAITPDAERTICYIARVTSANQTNEHYEGLIRYLLKHQHFSPFEHAYCTIEVETSRAVAAQLLRHRSFTFQEYSQRYRDVTQKPPIVKCRQQSEKNRQSSTVEMDQMSQESWEQLQHRAYDTSYQAYGQALAMGVAREQARMLLPLGTPTRLYMTGSVRSWLHLVELRTKPDTQQETREVVEGCKQILIQQLPVIASALGWSVL